MSRPRKQTPEGEALRAIVDYLRAAHIGEVKRVNVGQLRVGEAPRHPWAKDTRRIVRFGEVGASDLHVELSLTDARIPERLRGRDLFVEVKRADWHPPTVPAFGCAASTLEAYRHHVDQVQFLDRQILRGNLGLFARSPWEVYIHLVESGFRGLPVPQAQREAPARTTRTSGGSESNRRQK